MAWLAFLDLLATRSLSDNVTKATWRAFDDRLEQFQKCIGERTLDTKRISSYFFSDSAFIESPGLSEIVNFLSGLTHDLIGRNLYFKASLVPGKLAARRWSAPTQSQSRPSSDRVTGFAFGPQASLAYQEQERFAGMAVTVLPPESKILNDKLEKDIDFLKKEFDSLSTQFVHNFVVRTEVRKGEPGKQKTETYIALSLGNQINKIEKDEIEMSSFVDKIHDDMRDCILSSPRSLPKYFSLLGLYARSCTFQPMEYDENIKSFLPVSGIPLLVRDVLLNKRWDFFSKTPGHAELMWLCISLLFTAIRRRNAKFGSYDESGRVIAIRDPVEDRIIEIARRKLISTAPRKATNHPPEVFMSPSSVIGEQDKALLRRIWITQK